jgi:hypothetical protein
MSECTKLLNSVWSRVVNYANQSELMCINSDNDKTIELPRRFTSTEINGLGFTSTTKTFVPQPKELHTKYNEEFKSS